MSSNRHLRSSTAIDVGAWLFGGQGAGVGPQCSPKHFPCRCHREFIDEGDMPRDLIEAEPLSHVRLQLPLEIDASYDPRGEDDEGMNRFSRSSSGTPTTPAIATAAWELKDSSISPGPMR